MTLEKQRTNMAEQYRSIADKDYTVEHDVVAFLCGQGLM
jgi:hypothetical protein